MRKLIVALGIVGLALATPQAYAGGGHHYGHRGHGHGHGHHSYHSDDWTTFAFGALTGGAIGYVIGQRPQAEPVGERYYPEPRVINNYYYEDPPPPRRYEEHHYYYDRPADRR